MARIKIISPCKAYISFSSPEERSHIEEITKFKNTSKEFQYRRHQKNIWFKSKNFQEWQAHGAMLKAQIERSVLFEEDGQVCIRPGYLPYLAESISLDIETTLSYPKPKPYPWYNKPKEIPYPYQSISVEKMIEQKHAHVELCTGAGKSLIILMLVRELGLPAVVVTPSASIFGEMVERFSHHFGKNTIGMLGDGKKKFGKNITIAISDSLANLEPGTKEYEEIASAQVVIGDESHTIPAETREDVFHGVLKNAPYRFFLSGTQTRGDGTDKLLHAIIGSNVHSLSTKDAIEGGYVNDHSFKIVPIKTTSSVMSSDALAMKRSHFLNNPNIAQFVAKLANTVYESKKEQTLVLIDELPQILLLAPLLNVPYALATSADDKVGLISLVTGYDKAAIKKKIKEDPANYPQKFLDSMTEFQRRMYDEIKNCEPSESVEKFNNGTAKVLIGTSCISTGTNIYPTHHTVNWQGGASEIRTKQGAVGRSVRKLKGSKYEHLHVPKPKSIIWDFDVNLPVLKRHLKNRVKFYKSSGTVIEWIGGQPQDTETEEDSDE